MRKHQCTAPMTSLFLSATNSNSIGVRGRRWIERERERESGREIARDVEVKRNQRFYLPLDWRPATRSSIAGQVLLLGPIRAHLLRVFVAVVFVLQPRQ